MFAEWKLENCDIPGVEADMNDLGKLTDTMFFDRKRASDFTLGINREMPALIDARWDAIQAVARNLLSGEQSRADIEREMRLHPAKLQSSTPQ